MLSPTKTSAHRLEPLLNPASIAIVGASKHMHVVIEPLCTGCALCVPPCPVDCIVMQPPAA